jgi:hypothetical protein
MRITCKHLDRTSERGGHFGRPVCRWKDTIKTDFIEIIWEGLDWVCWAQGTCVNTLMRLAYHKKADLFCASIVTVVIIILRKVPAS